MTSEDRPLRPAEVAALFGVSETTVAVWADEGKLPHFRTPGRQRRFNRRDVDAFLATRPEPADPETAA